MAVKKANTKATDVKTEEITVEVELDETVVEEIKVEVEEPKVDVVEVDEKVAEVKESDRAEGKVKIRMRVDHKCCIAMERYDLKVGKTYTVPENVKRILNNAGLLAPL